jgi:predicted ester cyclase
VAAWNAHDPKALGDLMTDDVLMHDYTERTDQKSKKDSLAAAQRIWTGFGDAKGEVVDLWGAGDYTFAIMRNRGTNTGDVKEWKLKKTGKPIDFSSVEVYRWDGGKVKEGWGIANGMSIAQQLGMVPPMKAGAAGAGGDAAKAGDAAKTKKSAEPAPATP